MGKGGGRRQGFIPDLVLLGSVLHLLLKVLVPSDHREARLLFLTPASPEGKNVPLLSLYPLPSSVHTQSQAALSLSPYACPQLGTSPLSDSPQLLHFREPSVSCQDSD